MPKKVKLSLLDERLGKIQGVPVEADLPVGSLIDYWVTPKGDVYFLSAIDLLFVPLTLGRHDILFLHHVLEICYYFIPIDGVVLDIFPLFEFLYTHTSLVDHIRGKKIFLFKLLATLGVYPDAEEFQTPYLHHLAVLPIDVLMHKAIDVEGEMILDQWLAASVAIHPYVNYFKTNKFLTQSRIL